MWLLPSLNRIANLRRFLDAYRATGGSTPGAIIADQADFAASQAAYESLDLPRGWFIWQTASVTPGDKLREIWDRLAPCTWLGLIGDDCVPETAEWDKSLIAGLDGTNFVSCDDAWLAPNKVGNCWAISGGLVRTVGYILPPGLQHLFVDDVWETLGRATGCWRVRMDVRVRHVAVAKGDAPPGFTTANPGPDRHAGLWAADEAVVARWRAEALPDLTRAVTAFREAHSTALSPEEQARLARVKSRIVMICTPIARAPVWQYTTSLAETSVLLHQLGVKAYHISVVGSSNLPRARNLLAAKFLASDATDLLFIDDDVGWQPADVVRLLASDQPLIGGVIRKKIGDSDNPDGWCCNFLPGAERGLGTDAMGSVEVARVGTAFLRIERRVFEDMIRWHPEWKRSGAPDLPLAEQQFYYRFFLFGDDELGEDYVFCDRWRELDGHVFIDPSIKLSHVGETAITGTIIDLIRLVAPGSIDREGGG
jgi:hypothetical protein